MTITAKIIADSISESGIRITTLELEYPRFIHSQFMTHRQFSRNAQSSRAIPTAKQIEIVENGFIPTFRKNQAGMQAGEKIESIEKTECRQIWRDARSNAIFQAKRLLNFGIHKEVLNRLLEPFSTIKVVVTATEWDNFFKLRLHHDAQPEIQELAQAMKTAMDESTPVFLTHNQWHLPYIETGRDNESWLDDEFDYDSMVLISAARCARVSYLNHDNTNPDIEKDLELAHRLLKDGHLSPFEHQAKPMQCNDFYAMVNRDKKCGVTHVDVKGDCWSNNFKGWIQHRALL